MIYSRSYTGIIIVAAIVLVIAIICAIKRKRVYALVDSIYHRFFRRKKDEDEE
jgi:hypothetical protein